MPDRVLCYWSLGPSTWWRHCSTHDQQKETATSSIPFRQTQTETRSTAIYRIRLLHRLEFVFNITSKKNRCSTEEKLAPSIYIAAWKIIVSDWKKQKENIGNWCFKNLAPPATRDNRRCSNFSWYNSPTLWLLPSCVYTCILLNIWNGSNILWVGWTNIKWYVPMWKKLQWIDKHMLLHTIFHLYHLCVMLSVCMYHNVSVFTSFIGGLDPR